jgi:catechol 2,3-dioxygenase-like lactoylglutathione lyase family enzyme
MLDHIELAVSDIFRARAFYDQALVPLGVTRIHRAARDAGDPLLQRI